MSGVSSVSVKKLKNVPNYRALQEKRKLGLKDMIHFTKKWDNKSLERPREYTMGRELGRGRFGKVYMCRDKKTGKICAAKVFTEVNKELREYYMREVAMLKRLDHIHIAKLVDYFEDP